MTRRIGKTTRMRQLAMYAAMSGLTVVDVPTSLTLPLKEKDPEPKLYANRAERRRLEREGVLIKDKKKALKR